MYVDLFCWITNNAGFYVYNLHLVVINLSYSFNSALDIESRSSSVFLKKMSVSESFWLLSTVDCVKLSVTY